LCCEEETVSTIVEYREIADKQGQQLIFILQMLHKEYKNGRATKYRNVRWPRRTAVALRFCMVHAANTVKSPEQLEISANFDDKYTVNG